MLIAIKGQVKKSIKHIFICALSLFFFIHTQMYAQTKSARDLRISYTANNVSAEKILSDLEKSYDLEFRYRYDWIKRLRLSCNAENLKLDVFLNNLFKNSNLTFLFKEPNYIVLIKTNPSSISLNVKNIDSIDSLIILGTPGMQQSYDSVSLSGVIKSGETNEKLPGVTVQALEVKSYDVSDQNGYYSIRIPTGYHTIKYQSIESGEVSFNILINSPAEFNLDLFPNVIQLEDIVVRAQREDVNISETITGVEKITPEEIKRLPALLGEADVIKSVISLPGVSFSGETAAGFNVRGTGVGGNLILVDNATLFNTSHLFGVLTAFSPDAVEDVSLYKGTIPAKFGGRISSVLDIKFKGGNKERVTGSGGVGVMSSRLNIEAPVIKGKSSLFGGFRLAYPNYILRSLRNQEISNSRSSFGDLTFKYDHVINKKNRFFGTFYASNDEFTIPDQVDYDYNNRVGSLQWNRIFSKNLSGKFNYNVSQYNYQLGEVSDLSNEYSMNAFIRNNDFKADFTFVGWDSHLIDFGIQSTLFSLQPGEFSAENNVLEIEGISDLNAEEGLETALYLSDEFKITNDFSTYVGVRFSSFSDLEDTEYYGIEPRVSLNYRLNVSSSIKAGYNRMRQNIHLISNTIAVTPVDLWKLSSATIKPVIADQFSLGYFKNFSDNSIETSVEVYYRDIDNLIEFKNGANLFGNPQVDEELIQGEGQSYGLEYYIKKTKGKLTGWMSYTYSRSLARVEGANIAESINDGDLFPTNIDQPHNVNLFANLQTSRRFDMSFNFVYATGRPITYPTSVYESSGVSVINYDTRNNGRIPDYHRLDVSFHLATTLKKKKKVEADWTLTLYNVYSRRNAFSVFYQTSPNGNRNEAFKLSIIGQIIPALSYNFRF